MTKDKLDNNALDNDKLLSNKHYLSPLQQRQKFKEQLSSLEDTLRENDEETTLITYSTQQFKAPLMPPKDRISLFVIAGSLAGQMFHLHKHRVTIGRNHQCDIILRDNDISRKHLLLETFANSQVLLIDNNSTNGTFVNGRREQRCFLQDGDRIQLGSSTILRFSLQDELEEKVHVKLYENAVLDGLTQLYNRKYFHDQFQSEFSFAQRHQTPLSLLLTDVDFFKRFNDTYGHLVGDEVLKAIAQTIKQAVRKEDLVARYGGEEFVILVRGISHTQAAILGERIRSMVENKTVITDNSALSVTISIGIATMNPEQYPTPEALLIEADNRLYVAKKTGRNKVVAEPSKLF